MPRSYFRQVPNFEYVNRNYNRKNSNDFLAVKNLFKRVKIRDDIFQNLAYFGKYTIIGDERPDNIANKVYGQAEYDWVILLANNILNIHNEWPLSNADFESVMLEKYGSYENLNAVSHYEIREDVKNSLGQVLISEGTRVPEEIIDNRKKISGDENDDYLIKYVPYYIESHDPRLNKDVLYTNITVPVTNYQVEEKINDEKRNIFVLKQSYLGIVLSDLDKIMRYKKGSPQFLRENLKRADNIRLYG
jgi:hypothetical protein